MPAAAITALGHGILSQTFPIERASQEWILDIGVRVARPGFRTKPAPSHPRRRHPPWPRRMLMTPIGTLTGAPGRTSSGDAQSGYIRWAIRAAMQIAAWGTRGIADRRLVFAVGCVCVCACGGDVVCRRQAGPSWGFMLHGASLAALGGQRRGLGAPSSQSGDRPVTNPGAPPSGRWTRREAGRQVDCGAAWRGGEGGPSRPLCP